MSDDFDPLEHNRPPREEGFSEEADRFRELLDHRGDQRIGQLISNALNRKYDNGEDVLFAIEDDDLVDAIEEMLEDVGLLEESGNR